VTPQDSGWILVLGATGKQGGSTARYLLRDGWDVHAFVRDPRRSRAVDLAELGAVLVVGDLDDADSVRAAMRGAHGVFSVQTPLGPGGVPAEERHGELVADIAHEIGVGHYVHSSVGGAERPEGLHWRETKLRVEERITGHGLPATFLRPAYFMENLNMFPPLPDEGGGLVYRRGLAPGTRLQMIAAADIGYFAAEAFRLGATAIGAKTELAGDELTGDGIAAAFERHTGRPTRFDPIPPDELREISSWQADAYGWLNRIGYTADIPDLRARHPRLATLDAWLARTRWRPPEDVPRQATATLEARSPS
jgi:uncharacterized protein YbjT (DUF2867 family)